VIINIVIKRKGRTFREDLLNCSHFSCLPFLLARITLGLVFPPCGSDRPILLFFRYNIIAFLQHPLRPVWCNIFFWTVSVYLQGCTV